MTDYSELLSAGRIKRGRFSRKQVQDCLQIAERDIQTAQDLLESSPEWTFNIAYNAMHQAGRAYLFHEGYRTAGEAHHATVIRFLEISLGAKSAEPLMLMDRMRRKRNRATYDMVGTISHKEASEAISTARAFVTEIARHLK
jgi:uncharacterized protein (UPF0332 family)